MIITQGSRLLFVRLELEPDEIPNLLTAHRKRWEPPDRLENEAQALIAQDFPEGVAAEFAEDVVKWGRGHRFVGRFRQKNSDRAIASALRQAVAQVRKDQVTQAVSHVQQLGQLGQSFASKLVRFLCPDRAVILDEVIRTSLGYKNSLRGYEEFLIDCQYVLEHAQPTLPHLRICDVEAAIFAKIQGY